MDFQYTIMHTAYSLSDYRPRFFEYKDLERIHGQPTIDSIARLLWQVKRNAQRVSTTLGGGKLGYLTLVTSLADYISIPNSSIFRRPIDSGTFNRVAAGLILRNEVALTTADISTQRIAYEDQLRKYNECQAVETALHNQIIAANKFNYLQPIRNVHTDMIKDTIPEIIIFLSNTYGQLSPL